MKRVVTAVILIACLNQPATATEPFSKVGIILNTLRVTTSVPALGLGGSGTADPGDPSNAALNPAIFAGSNHAMAYTASLDAPDQAEVRNLQLSGAFSFKQGRIRVGLGIFYTSRQTSPRQIQFFTPSGTDTSFVSRRDDSYFGGAIAAALQLGKLNFSAGVAPKQVRVRDEGFGVKEDATVWDMGGLLWRPLKLTRNSNLVPSVGVSYLNAGSDEFFKIPGSIRYSVRVRYENWRWTQYGEWAGPDTPFVTFSVNYDAIDPQLDGAEFEYAMGAELAFVELLFIRGGWRDDGTDGEPVLGAGLGPVTDRFLVRIDGAWSEGDAGAFSFVAGVVF